MTYQYTDALRQLIEQIFLALREDQYTCFNFPVDGEFISLSGDFTFKCSNFATLVENEGYYATKFNHNKAENGNIIQREYQEYCNQIVRPLSIGILFVWRRKFFQSIRLLSNDPMIDCDRKSLCIAWDGILELFCACLNFGYFEKQLNCQTASILVAYLLLSCNKDLIVIQVNSQPNPKVETQGIGHDFLLVFPNKLPDSFSLEDVATWPKEGYIVDFWNKNIAKQHGFACKVDELDVSKPHMACYSSYGTQYLWEHSFYTLGFAGIPFKKPQESFEGIDLDELGKFMLAFWEHLKKTIPTFNTLDALISRIKARINHSRVTEVLSANTTCSFCGKNKPGLKRCSRCRTAQYCDANCQRDDWLKHKPYCNATA